jgi:hypothetical protein
MTLGNMRSLSVRSLAVTGARHARTLFPLGDEPQFPDTLQNPPEGRPGGETHSSIRVQEGEPTKSNTYRDDLLPQLLSWHAPGTLILVGKFRSPCHPNGQAVAHTDFRGDESEARRRTTRYDRSQHRQAARAAIVEIAGALIVSGFYLLGTRADGRRWNGSEKLPASTFSDGHRQPKTLVSRMAPPVPPTRHLLQRHFLQSPRYSPQLVPQGETKSERIDTEKNTSRVRGGDPRAALLRLSTN